MTPLISTICIQPEPQPVHYWPTRDLIRLWPWLLPAFLIFSLTCHRFGDVLAAMTSALTAIGCVWMTFLIARRLWGYHKAHTTATALMLALGAFSLVITPMPDLSLSFIVFAATAALVHHRSWLFISIMILAFLWQGLSALLMPLSGLLGWWLANGLKHDLLRARHGLLLGWSLPLPFLMIHHASTLEPLVLSVFSALILALRPSMAFSRRLWKLGSRIPATE